MIYLNRILNVEGIPGAGKTFGAKQLNELSRQRGIDSYWVPEVISEHPAKPRHLPSDVASCVHAFIESWTGFVQMNSRVAILDGYALQSTVRHLFAKNASTRDMRAYFKDWLRIGGEHVSIVFFHVPEPEKHFREFVFPLRGNEWVTKVSDYVARTDYGHKHGLSGESGLIEFWSKYQSLCLDLLDDAQPFATVQSHRELSWILD